MMKVLHKPELDYVTIDFKEGVEAKSVYNNGVIVRYDKKNNVIGIDITDSSKFFASSDTVSLKEACAFLGISESTMRRRIKQGKIKFKKSSNGKDYKFKKSDVLKAA
jgi:excisionase family DNA binding protein